MRPVALCFIQDRALQQVSREHSFVSRFRVGQVYAIAVVCHLHSGSDLTDGIRYAVQQAQFIEERQVALVDCNVEHVVAHHFDAGQFLFLAADIVFISGNIFRGMHSTAKLRHFRRHGQQEGEGIVPGGDLCSVAVEQIPVQRHDEGHIAVVLGLNHHTAHYGIIRYEHALFRVPLDQVITMDHVPDVQVAAAVSPQVGKEVSGQRRCHSHRHFIIIIRNLLCFFRRSFFRSGFRPGGTCCQHHHEGQQQCQQFLHSVVPLCIPLSVDS